VDRMPQLNQDSAMVVQPELTAGESIAWAGQPKAGVVFHKEDLYLIPFSLLWGGFALFWEFAASGGFGGFRHASNGPVFFQLWGIPFILVGQYLIWGRFVYVAWLKKRTHYAVTNKRVIVVQNGWKRQIASSYIDSLPSLIKEGSSNGVGVLRFAPSQPTRYGRQGWGVWNSLSVGDVPAFMDIDDVDSVYRMVSDMREKARTAKPAF